MPLVLGDATAPMEPAERKRYGRIEDVPTHTLAANFVTSLILCKGNLNQYQALTEMLIRQLRGEPEPE